MKIHYISRYYIYVKYIWVVIWGKIYKYIKKINIVISIECSIY